MSIYIGDKEIKNLYVGDSSAKEVYLGDTKIYPNGEPFDIDWDNYDTLYSGSGGDIIHGYNSSYGEIRVRDLNGNSIIIADRNYGVTNVNDYGGYYDSDSPRAVPDGYHYGSYQERQNLINLLISVTGTNDWGVYIQYLLLPKAGYWHSSYKDYFKVGEYASYRTTTSAGSNHWLFENGGFKKAYGLTRTPRRPFKNVE